MLTMKTKYGLRALAVMGHDPQKSWQAKAIAETADIPLKFLETILVALRHNGIIASKRGASGGHMLARAASSITVGEIIRVFEKMIAPLPCASAFAYQPCDECADPAGCEIRHLMMDVRNAMSRVLDTRTIQDLIDNKKEGELL